jgi:hypothetical protein
MPNHLGEHSGATFQYSQRGTNNLNTFRIVNKSSEKHDNMTRRILHPLFHLLGSLTHQEMARQVSYLKEENKVLRERLPDRISTTEQERKRLIRAGKKLGPQFKDLMSIVTYQSFRHWVR